MKVTNDQIDKLTEIVLDSAIRRGLDYKDVLAEFEEQIGMRLPEVRSQMDFESFQAAYRTFCVAKGYRS